MVPKWNKAMKTLQTLTVNFRNGPIRNEKIDGVDFTVAPATFMVEGVHAGSSGPVFYSREELAKDPSKYNKFPVVNIHPKKENNYISASEVPEEHIGFMDNTVFNESTLSLDTEVWIENSKAKKKDKRILANIAKKEKMEVSIGIAGDLLANSGVWNGIPYHSIVTNIDPDHLAILVDGIGACSIACGCGLLQVNEKHPIANLKSWGDITRDLRTQMEARVGYSAYIMDVYDNWFVYSYNGKLWKLGYKASDLEVTISQDLPVEVYYVTQYKTADGAVIGNSAMNPKEEREYLMDRKTAVDKLIANHGWNEGQRKFLMDLSEDNFKPIFNSAATPPTPPAPSPTPAPAPAPAPSPTPTPPTVNKVQTAEEYIQSVPPGPIRDMLTNGLHAHKAEVDQLVKIILANEKNAFEESLLRTKEIAELRAIAALAQSQPQQVNNEGVTNGIRHIPPSYFGSQGAPPATATKAINQKPLIPPGYIANEEEKAKK